MHDIHSSEGHLLVLISSESVVSSMSRKTSTRVCQVTGCFPLPSSHSWRISVFIDLASFECLCSIISTLDPFLSSRRKVPNSTYLVAISTGMLTILPSGHLNFSSSFRVGLVSGFHRGNSRNIHNYCQTPFWGSVIDVIKLRTVYGYRPLLTHHVERKCPL